MKSYKPRNVMYSIEVKAIKSRPNIEYMVEVPLNRVARRELDRREKKASIGKAKDGNK